MRQSSLAMKNYITRRTFFINRPSGKGLRSISALDKGYWRACCWPEGCSCWGRQGPTGRPCSGPSALAWGRWTGWPAATGPACTSSGPATRPSWMSTPALSCSRPRLSWWSTMRWSLPRRTTWGLFRRYDRNGWKSEVVSRQFMLLDLINNLYT